MPLPPPVRHHSRWPSPAPPSCALVRLRVSWVSRPEGAEEMGVDVHQLNARIGSPTLGVGVSPLFGCRLAAGWVSNVLLHLTKVCPAIIRLNMNMKLCAAVLLFYILKHTCGQPDSQGFISIKCGILDKSSYQDLSSSIVYVSDHDFISSGQNRNISSDYIKPTLAWRNYNVRFFPDGIRNCYTLRSLVAGNKYFVRATFYYGNYDGLNRLRVFDLYLGANYWHEVNFRGAGSVNWMDIIAVAPADYLQVCLVNKGMGTPFISGLDLRPLKSSLYPESNSSQSLVLVNSNRFNMGPTDNSIIRYPLDPHDRLWSTYDTIPSWKEVSATSVVQNYLTDAYDVPLAVMQNAAAPVNGSRIDFSWDPSDPSVNISSRYFFVFYFSELQSVASNALRQFDIIVNNSTWNTKPYTPPFLFADSISGIVQGQGRDLSHNNLYGSIPDVLGQLPLLVFLDLASNALSGPIPYSLLQKSRNGTLSISKSLTWEQRLHIALDAAQGLEYLHVGCKPPLIHRDVKSRNILLSTDLSAKIADFGLTKAFSDSKTHISTQPAGTMGYLDPEYILYYLSYQISEKSDVYSFGVVLLELITAHSPVVPINDSVSIHIGEWVHQNLEQGSIESIVDSRMGGDYGVNSVWKVADLALHCKHKVSRERPTMTDVVAQIKEIMELEARRDRKQSEPVLADGDLSYTGETSAFEVEGSVGTSEAASPGSAMR
nr:unnamed protein product [Digitaria exilis]